MPKPEHSGDTKNCLTLTNLIKTKQQITFELLHSSIESRKKCLKTTICARTNVKGTMRPKNADFESERVASLLYSLIEKKQQKVLEILPSSIEL